jgi:hypothetical protein
MMLAYGFQDFSQVGFMYACLGIFWGVKEVFGSSMVFSVMVSVSTIP